MWEDKVLCAQKQKTGQTGQAVIHSREMQLFSYKTCYCQQMEHSSALQ